MTKLKHFCEHCNKPHMVYPNEIKRGRGQFCCKFCAGGYNFRAKVKVKCPTCGVEFVTFVGREFCSVNCMDKSSDDIVNEVVV